MSSMATTHTRSPFRLFTSPEIPSGPPLALGRSHNSWFLIYAHPYGRSLEREALCLNYIIPTTSGRQYDGYTSAGTYSSKGQPRFIIGGTIGEKVLKTVLSLRDEKDVAPIKVCRDHSHYGAHYENTHKLCAEVEVRIPESEVAQACAHCGRWETQYGPRFRCCGNCKKSYYCSKECQKADWKTAYHKGECALLKDGKFYDVESRRPLHNNGWWFDNSAIGTKELLAGPGEVEFNRALDACDYLYLAYGKSTPPHDVPPITRAAPSLPGTSPTSTSTSTANPLPTTTDLPPGFIPTGNTHVDAYLIESHRFLSTDPPASLTDALHTLSLSAPTRTRTLIAADIPALPPLPPARRFARTGDPALDETRLYTYLHRSGSAREQRALTAVIARRRQAVAVRERLAAEVFGHGHDDEGSRSGRAAADVYRARELDSAYGLDRMYDSDLSSMESLRTVSDSSEDEF